MCSNVSDHRNAGSSKGKCPYDDGLPVVLDVRESRNNGEGAEEMFIPKKREEHVICDHPKPFLVCLKIEANEEYR